MSDSPAAVLHNSSGTEVGTPANPVRTDPTGSTTQPVSGTVTANAGTGPFPISDNGGSITVDGPLTDTQLRASAVPVTGALTDTQLRASAVPVSMASAPLPTGAATETTLAAISTKTPALGQATMANSSPVAIASNQSAIPVSGTVTANAGTGPFPVSDNGGSLTVDGPLTDTQLRASAVAISGALTDSQLRATAVPVSGPLTDTQLRATAVPVSGTVTANIGTTNGVALDATLTGGTQKAIARGGAKGVTAAADITSTAEGSDHQALDVQIMHSGVAKDPTQIRALTSSDVVTAAQATAANLNATVAQGAAGAAAWKVDGSAVTQPVSGPLTDTQLRASAVPVTGPLTDTQLRASAVPVSAASLPLPVGAATDATLSAASAKLPASLGQKAMSASMSVALASDQSTIAVSGPLTDTQLRASAVPVVGNKTNNNAAPGTNNVGALPAVATASAPTLTEGNQVGLSTDLAGNLRVTSTGGGGGGVAQTQVRSAANAWTDVGYSAGNLKVPQDIQQIVGAAPSATNPLPVRITDGGGFLEQVSRNGNRYLASSITQDVEQSAGNSSTTNLAAGASFTGSNEVLSGVGAIRVSFFADQACRIEVQQSVDGTNYDITDAWIRPPSFGSSRVVQVTGTSARVVVTNLGGVATTALRLSTGLCPIAEPLPRALSENGRIALAMRTTSWAPSPDNFMERDARPELLTDVSNALITRSNVLTDAASFRDDFTSGGLTTNLTGTVYFVSGSIHVSGNGSTLFLSEVKIGDFIKLSTHANSTWGRVAQVWSDNYLTLENNYSGATANGTAHTSSWVYEQGTGTSLSQSSSELGVTLGTTNNAECWAMRTGDYEPYVIMAKLRASQRIANQELIFGMMDDKANPQNQAVVVFSGTDNTQVRLRTSFSSLDLEETVKTLPGGATSATGALYRLEVTDKQVILWVNNNVLIRHETHIPGPYAPMSCYLGGKNVGTPASSTTFYADVVAFANFDRVEVQSSAKGDPLPTKEIRSNEVTTTRVSASATSVTLLSANPNRLGATIFNDSTADMYVKFGATASATSKALRIARYDYYEVPQWCSTSRIDAIWTAATGAADVTETV